MIVTIGVDIGTTAVKAVAVDDDGNVVASVRRPHALLTPVPGAIEHDAVDAWRDGVRAATVDVAKAAIAAGAEIAAVNITAMVPSLCAVDADGDPLGPGLLYADPRLAGGERGADLTSSGEFTRMVAWLAEHYPDAAGYWPAQAVANHALTGVGAIDVLVAFGATPLFEMDGWSTDVAASIGVGVDRLPVVIGGTDPVGTCTGLGPVLDGVPVGGGSLDAYCEQLVAGADQDGDVLVILGATLITWAVVDRWIEVPGLWSVPHTARGMTMVGGASNAGGIFRNWASGVLQSPDPDEIIDPDDVPVWLPYVRGERTPVHDPARRGLADGLHIGQGPAAMWRGVHEATGFVVRHHLELAGVLGPERGSEVAPLTRARRIVVTGGGAHDAAWVQAIADATGLPVDCAAVPEGGARGAAFLARVTAGLERNTRSASRWAGVDRRVEPDPAWVGPTALRYARFLEATGPIDASVGLHEGAVTA